MGDAWVAIETKVITEQAVTGAQLAAPQPSKQVVVVSPAAASNPVTNITLYVVSTSRYNCPVIHISQLILTTILF